MQDPRNRISDNEGELIGKSFIGMAHGPDETHNGEADAQQGCRRRQDVMGNLMRLLLRHPSPP